MNDVARIIDEMAAPVFVDCVECGAVFEMTRGAQLYCSELCQQTPKFVRYARAAIADGRYERDPSVRDAVQMKVAHILAGGYHERARRMPKAFREQIFARDGHQCVLCGAPATQIDHIAGDANTPANLRSSCGECNLGMAQEHLGAAPPREAAKADQLRERVFAPTPLHECDDEKVWPGAYRRLMGERGARLRNHRAIEKFLGRGERTPVREP